MDRCSRCCGAAAVAPMGAAVAAGSAADMTGRACSVGSAGMPTWLCAAALAPAGESAIPSSPDACMYPQPDTCVHKQSTNRLQDGCHHADHMPASRAGRSAATSGRAVTCCGATPPAASSCRCFMSSSRRSSAFSFCSDASCWPSGPRFNTSTCCCRSYSTATSLLMHASLMRDKGLLLQQSYIFVFIKLQQL